MAREAILVPKLENKAQCHSAPSSQPEHGLNCSLSGV